MSSRHAIRHVAMMYAEVMALDGLQQAEKVELLEQWEHRLPLRKDGVSRGSIRVGRTEYEGRVRYTATIWRPEPMDAPKGQFREYSVAITESYFQAWSGLFGDLREQSTVYYFTVKEVKLTVDGVVVTLPEVCYVAYVYPEARDGHTWCKVTADLVPVYAYIKKHHPDVAGFDDQALFDALPFKPRRLLPFASKRHKTNN